MMNIEDLQNLKKQLQPENIPLERRTKIVGNQMIEGEPFPYLENIIRVLRFDSRLENAIRLNEFTQQVHVKFPDQYYSDSEILSDTDEVWLADWLSRVYQLRVNMKMLHEAIIFIARENRYHPVREWMKTLEWDGEKRLETMLIDWCGVSDSELHRAYSKRWLIGAVKRLFHASSKDPVYIKSILVLTGQQNFGKSMFLKTLCGNQEWFADTKFNMNHEYAALKLQGKFIYELAEWAGRSKDAEIEKAFISSASDTVKVPYARNAVTLPRQGIMVVTSNRMDLLTDSTGSTRFWCVQVGETMDERFDRDSFSKVVPQIWAEAIHYMMEDEQHWLTDEEEQLRMDEADIFSTIDPWLDKLESGEFTKPLFLKRGRVDVVDFNLAMNLLEVPMQNRTSGTRSRIEFCLKKLGYQPYMANMPNGKRVRCYRYNDQSKNV